MRYSDVLGLEKAVVNNYRSLVLRSYELLRDLSLDTRAIAVIHKEIREKYPKVIGIGLTKYIAKNLGKVAGKGKKTAYANIMAYRMDREIRKIAYPYALILISNLRNSILNREKNKTDFIWLCSAHGDCAKDHEPYQGKYYLDPSYETKLSEMVDYKASEVRAWMTLNGIKQTITEIYNGEPYLGSRPYCRHYFRLIPLKLAMDNDPLELCRELGMWHPIGQRGNIPRFSKKTAQKRLKDLFS